MAPPARSRRVITAADCVPDRRLRSVGPEAGFGAGAGMTAAGGAADVCEAAVACAPALLVWRLADATLGAGCDCFSSVKCSSSRRMALQMRLSAVVRSVNFFTGFRSPSGTTPAKPFQTSTSRAIGQSAVAFLRSLSELIAMVSGSAVGAVSWTVRMLSESIVKCSGLSVSGAACVAAARFHRDSRGGGGPAR